MPGQPESRVLSLGHPERSALPHRKGSRDPIAQMPPLGTVRVDHLRRWIADAPFAPSH